MTELAKVLEQLKQFLKEAGYEESAYLETMQTEELNDFLRKFKREIKRKESVYSPNSAQYKNLK